MANEQNVPPQHLEDRKAQTLAKRIESKLASSVKKPTNNKDRKAA
jgi:hypothetical protein